jgi:lysosomal acid phosphatase
LTKQVAFSAYFKNGCALQKGKRRMYLLGQHIRTRYSAFLPPLYLPEHLYVLSSDADRCIMSAECFLTALYPPLPFQKIHPELNWQPIPVHTVPRDLDRVKKSLSLELQTLEKYPFKG